MNKTQSTDVPVSMALHPPTHQEAAFLLHLADKVLRVTEMGGRKATHGSPIKREKRVMRSQR